MPQTKEGALKNAARNAGLTPEEYQALVAQGSKWCTGCKAWHPRDAFGKDRSRPDGLEAYCKVSKSAKHQRSYVPKERERGRIFVPGRPGDALQARRRVNFRVESGLLPHPNTLPCTDCGHVWRATGDRRHEYDHFLGYAPEHHEDVQAVCTSCHHKRERERGEAKGG